VPKIDVGGIAINVRQWGSGDPVVLIHGLGMSSDFDVADDVKSIRLPTLALVGEHDRIIPPQRGRELAALIPNAHLIEIPGVGHLS
jgi:pimeloyl-ACP methyl ester carboxylesterase